jgi:hypothetical protein
MWRPAEAAWGPSQNGRSETAIRDSATPESCAANTQSSWAWVKDFLGPLHATNVAERRDRRSFQATISGMPPEREAILERIASLREASQSGIVD